MRHSLSGFALALVTTAWLGNAAAAVAVLQGDACPAGDAITARLRHLGALELVSQLGAAEVRVDGVSLHVAFRDRKGDALGERVLTAPADCAARAALAAAVIAAFAGEWAQTALVPTAAATAAKTLRPTAAQPAWQSELGASGMLLHDGDASGFGLGVRADLGRGNWLASALFEAASERQQPLGVSHRGAYRFVRAGLGLGLGKRWSRLFWDVTVVPMLDRLALAGRDLDPNYTVTRWGFAVAGRTRFGWTAWRLRPFLFAGVSYRIPGERMTIEDRPEVRVPLSAVNVEAGLGISFRIIP